MMMMMYEVTGCDEGHQLTTFNKQSRILVGAAIDRLGRLTHPFHGTVAGLYIPYTPITQGLHKVYPPDNSFFPAISLFYPKFK